MHRRRSSIDGAIATTPLNGRTDDEAMAVAKWRLENFLGGFSIREQKP